MLARSLGRLSLGSTLRLLSRAPCSSRAASKRSEEDDGFNRLDTSRRPLGDQKAIFHQHNIGKMRSSGSDRYEGGFSNGRSSGDYGGASGGYGGGRKTGYGSGSVDRQQFGGGGYRGGGRGGSQGMAGGQLGKVDWSREKMNTVNKDLYVENPAVTARSQVEIDEWLATHQVTLEGPGIPRPVFEFSETPFPREIVERLNESFQKPSVIQAISWPIAMSGRDIISVAKTGSGKTLAFMLPALVHTAAQTPRERGDGPSVLVMAPTRELAQQVQEVSLDYCNALGLKMTCLFGGAAKGPQATALENGVDVVIATPGRLLDFVSTGGMSLRRCSFLVLDEADRMLDMGFEPQIRKVVSQIRPDRQSMMFSATWPQEVRALARDFQKEAAFLNVGSLELAANHNITQIVEVIEEYGKRGRLIKLLKEITSKPESKTLIFTQMKRKADEITRWMRQEGYPALSIHGDKSQSERDWALKEFKSGNAQILLATDVAARGLDVDDIKFVINYDYSNNSEDYVHRIGRTGRRDKKGTAYTFFTPDDCAKAADLIKILDEAKQTVAPELRELTTRTSTKKTDKGGSAKRSFGGSGGYGRSGGYGGRGGYGGDGGYGSDGGYRSEKRFAGYNGGRGGGSW